MGDERWFAEPENLARALAPTIVDEAQREHISGERRRQLGLAEGPLDLHLAVVDALAVEHPEEALHLLLDTPPRSHRGRDDELVDELRRRGTPPSNSWILNLSARHEPWIAENLPSLIDGMGGPSWVAGWYLDRGLDPPAKLRERLWLELRSSKRSFVREAALLARAGDERIVVQAARHLEGSGAFRRRVVAVTAVLAESPLAAADTALRDLFGELLARLEALTANDLPPDLREKRWRGLVRGFRGWVLAHLAGDEDLARGRIGLVVERFGDVPFVACELREVLEQRPRLESEVLGQLSEDQQGLLEDCLLTETEATQESGSFRR